MRGQLHPESTESFLYDGRLREPITCKILHWCPNILGMSNKNGIEVIIFHHFSVLNSLLLGFRKFW